MISSKVSSSGLFSVILLANTNNASFSKSVLWSDENPILKNYNTIHNDMNKSIQILWNKW